MPNVFVRVSAAEMDDVAAALRDAGFRPTLAGSPLARGGLLPEVVELIVKQVNAGTVVALLGALKLLIDSRKVGRLVVRVGDRQIRVEKGDASVVDNALATLRGEIAPPAAPQESDAPPPQSEATPPKPDP